MAPPCRGDGWNGFFSIGTNAPQRERLVLGLDYSIFQTNRILVSRAGEAA
jgi:hypothetical protein